MLSNAFEAPASPAGLLFADLEEELATTRRMLERFPADQAAWQPHEKSTPLGVLAEHIADLPRFAMLILRNGELDFGRDFFAPRGFTSREPLLAYFEERVAELLAELEGIDFPALARECVLRVGEHELMRRPADVLVRGMLNHQIHHRGQLSVYYRMVGVPLPWLYGPTADEPFGG